MKTQHLEKNIKYITVRGHFIFPYLTNNMKYLGGFGDLFTFS